MGFFMAYTAADLTSIETAIMNLATGAQIVRVTLNGKTLEYSPASLETLLTMKSIVSQALGSTITRSYARTQRRGTI